MPFWIGAVLSLLVVIPALFILKLARQGRLKEAPAPAD
jgi:hypothetical protein